jgi:hypothetical protein
MSLVCGILPLVVCAISSKFYTQDEELHAKLTKLVNKLAWSVPERGYKSVEVRCAYLPNTEERLNIRLDRSGLSPAFVMGKSSRTI